MVVLGSKSHNHRTTVQLTIPKKEKYIITYMTITYMYVERGCQFVSFASKEADFLVESDDPRAASAAPASRILVIDD